MQTHLHTNPLLTFRPEDLLGREPIVLDLQKAIQELRGRSILITGAAGTIGSGLATKICACAPASVVLIDQAETALYELDLLLRQQFPEINISCHIASITDALRMAELFSRTHIHILFHAAAYKHVPLMESHPYEAIIPIFSAPKSWPIWQYPTGSRNLFTSPPTKPSGPPA